MAEAAEVIKEAPDKTRMGVGEWMSGIKAELPNPVMGGQPAAIAPPDPKPETPPATPPKPAAPPAEPPPVADETKWPRNAEQWKAYKAESKKREEELAKQLNEWQTKHKELETKLSVPPAKDETSIKELEQTRKELDTYSEQLRLLAVERHPKFKAHYDGRVNAAIADAKEIVGIANADRVAEILAMPDSQQRTNDLNDIIVTLSPMDQAQFGGVVHSLRSIERERKGEIARAKQDYEKMVASESERSKSQQARFNKSVQDAVSTAQDAKMGRPEYQLRDNDQAWNEGVSKRIEQAKRLMTEKLGEADIFRAAMDAAAYPAVLEQAKALMAEVSKLNEQVKSLSAATPGIKTDRGTAPSSTNGKPPSPTPTPGSRPMELTRNWVAGMRAAQNQD